MKISKPDFSRVAIKVGSNVITQTDGSLNDGRILHLVEDSSEFGSKHSEAIISENKNNVQLFYNIVDASSIYSNASTAFTDGSEFGLGDEIGISTQKLHARGPMSLEAFTTYKRIIDGNGQIRK